jgi:hypothetical protein
MNQPRCRGCNKVIEWIEVPEDVNGVLKFKRIPLDPRAPTWEFNGERWVRSAARVSHFATCPAADQFSASKREEPVQQDLMARRPYKED